MLMNPMDYNNPNDYWNGKDPCKGMTAEVYPMFMVTVFLRLPAQ